MKRKRIDWDAVPWTPFAEAVVPPGDDTTARLSALDSPSITYLNSRYQVAVYAPKDGPNGPMVHLSIKARDKSARHDWRDLQRIKNELCGPEAEAVELYPAESRLVDTANQYHLFVFKDYRFPFGFHERLVGEGNWRNSRQRPFAPDVRPSDCLAPDQYEAKVQEVIAAHAPENVHRCLWCRRMLPCDKGVLAPDPYNAAVNDNHTPVWACHECRQERADAI